VRENKGKDLKDYGSTPSLGKLKNRRKKHFIKHCCAIYSLEQKVWHSEQVLCLLATPEPTHRHSTLLGE